MLCESNLESQARRAEQKYSPNPAFSKIFVNPYERRYNGTNPGNLTLRAKDKNTGLSFSTIPPINNKTAAVTTIEEVNSTGNLIAVQDGPSHVSIKPRNGTMSDWIKAGTNSIWTKNIKANCKTVSEVTFL